MSIYDGGGWGNLSTERPGSLVDSGRTRRLPAFHSQQHWMERAHCRRQHLKNQEIGFFGVFDRESISHGPTSLKIVVVVVLLLVGVLKTLVLFIILSMKYSSYPQYFIFSMKHFIFSMKYFIFSIKYFMEFLQFLRFERLEKSQRVSESLNSQSCTFKVF